LGDEFQARFIAEGAKTDGLVRTQEKKSVDFTNPQQAQIMIDKKPKCF